MTEKIMTFQLQSHDLVTHDNYWRGPRLLLASVTGGFALPTYRLYRLDGAANIVTADWLEAQSDEEAIRVAQERAKPGRFELWDRNRMIGSSTEPPS